MVYVLSFQNETVVALTTKLDETNLAHAKSEYPFYGDTGLQSLIERGYHI